MAFMSVNQETVAKTGDGANGIYTSGIFDVTIGALTLDVNENGARQIGAYLSIDGGENYQMLYGILPLDLYDNSQTLDNNEAVLQRLATIAGFDTIEDPEDMVLPIGKSGADKDCQVFSQFEGFECKMWVKQEYSKGKDGRVYENRILKDVFRTDKASADEIVNDTEVGVKYGKREQFFEDVKYKNITEEEVKAWIDAGRPKEPTGGSTGGAAKGPKKTFGAKKFGAK